MSARILVVDDSASMRQMVSFALTSAGFAVEEAEDGAVALGRAKGQRFNAVVTDVNMPNMDGISLIRELRQLPDYKFTPCSCSPPSRRPTRNPKARPLAPPVGWSSRSIQNS